MEVQNIITVSGITLNMHPELSSLILFTKFFLRYFLFAVIYKVTESMNLGFHNYDYLLPSYSIFLFFNLLYLLFIYFCILEIFEDETEYLAGDIEVNYLSPAIHKLPNEIFAEVCKLRLFVWFFIWNLGGTCAYIFWSR